MQTVKSPWGSTFREFLESIQESAIIVAPFIDRRPLEWLTRELRPRRTVRLDVLTSLASHSLATGVVDCGALHYLCEQVPDTTVRHLLNLHAKAYIADRHTAIVTSANLTDAGVHRNFELGVKVTEPQQVVEIYEDLQEYGDLGTVVACDDLAELDAMARRARDLRARVERGTDQSLTTQYDMALRDISERLIDLRVSSAQFTSDPEGSITSQFSDAVKFVLRRHGPLETREIGPLVRSLKPELCDDEVERVINGRSFGKRWKHDVRNAQQQLKRDGVIVLKNRRWRLT